VQGFQEGLLHNRRGSKSDAIRLETKIRVGARARTRLRLTRRTPRWTDCHQLFEGKRVPEDGIDDAVRPILCEVPCGRTVAGTGHV
jgi:hypothetical protein